MKKLHRFAVTLDKWASPVFIDAYTIENATKRAIQLFPVCDCGCKEPTEITKVVRLR